MQEGLPVTSRSGTLEQVERDHILRVLRENKGVVSVAAMHLGMPRTTLNAMMKKLGISRRDF
jgi:transcriptional regulator with GAF, ATPase, and Fis domain